MGTPTQVIEFAIGGMRCVGCSSRIERELNQRPGIEAAVNLAAERAHVRYDPAQATPDTLIATIVAMGFTATRSSADTRGEEKARKETEYRAELRRFPPRQALRNQHPVRDAGGGIAALFIYGSGQVRQHAEPAGPGRRATDRVLRSLSRM